MHDASPRLAFQLLLGRTIGFGGGDFEGKGVTWREELVIHTVGVTGAHSESVAVHLLVHLIVGTPPIRLSRGRVLHCLESGL